MSIMDYIEQKGLWDSFLERWPLDSLSSLSLDTYSKAGNLDTFCYWLEGTTEALGSIWGGSAFKFGVYSRGDKTAKESGRGRLYDDTYGWLKKYGPTPQAAFSSVLAIIQTVATAARAGDLSAVDAADLGEAVKWKIAFLYQNREQPCVLPIFKADFLRLALNSREKTVSRLHAAMLANLNGRDIQVYGAEVYASIDAKLRTELTPEQAEAFLHGHTQFSANPKPTKYIAGFRTDDGLEIGLVRNTKRTTLFLAPGHWVDMLDPRTLKEDVSHYPPQRNRNSNLGSQAPSLANGNEAYSVVVPTLINLMQLVDAYIEQQGDTPDDLVKEISRKEAKMPALNQILYGPPGTGKTYATIDAALEIIDPEFLAKNPTVPASELAAYTARREKLKARFDELCVEERIRFVTFHQSFSYEDFVEGIRADVDVDDQSVASTAAGVRYRVAKGVFAELCQDAKRDKKLEAEFGIREGARIWKISIEEADSAGQTRDYCLKNNEARIGWPDLGDIRKANLKDTAFGLADNQQSSLDNFAFQISEGDVLVCLGSVKTIRAVGVVTGPYEYAPAVPVGVREDYVHKLPVRWLASGLNFDITPLNKGVRLTLKTVYELWRFTWPDLFESLTAAQVPLANASQAELSSKEPYVLVIDEINRGNVSRIFGELITLVEPSKRASAPEALETILPYSKGKFSVPPNVYLIGTMNTADRSLTGLDVALRRRFEFREMPPQPDLLDHVRVEGVSVSVGDILRVMNKRIELLLDRDHCLGHAYFMSLEDKAPLNALADVFRLKVLPLLQEYFFEDWQRIQWVLNDHRKADDSLRFVQQPKSEIKDLFGEIEGLNEQQRRWEINAGAFEKPDSFNGIVRVAGGE